MTDVILDMIYQRGAVVPPSPTALGVAREPE
jgi:hypothetical protein